MKSRFNIAPASLILLLAALSLVGCGDGTSQTSTGGPDQLEASATALQPSVGYVQLGADDRTLEGTGFLTGGHFMPVPLWVVDSEPQQFGNGHFERVYRLDEGDRLVMSSQWHFGEQGDYRVSLVLPKVDETMKGVLSPFGGQLVDGGQIVATDNNGCEAFSLELEGDPSDQFAYALSCFTQGQKRSAIVFLQTTNGSSFPSETKQALLTASFFAKRSRPPVVGRFEAGQLRDLPLFEVQTEQRNGQTGVVVTAAEGGEVFIPFLAGGDSIRQLGYGGGELSNFVAIGEEQSSGVTWRLTAHPAEEEKCIEEDLPAQPVGAIEGLPDKFGASRIYCTEGFSLKIEAFQLQTEAGASLTTTSESFDRLLRLVFP